jgi:hypothetical protein
VNGGIGLFKYKHEPTCGPSGSIATRTACMDHHALGLGALMIPVCAVSSPEQTSRLPVLKH